MRRKQQPDTQRLGSVAATCPMTNSDSHRRLRGSRLSMRRRASGSIHMTITTPSSSPGTSMSLLDLPA